MVAADSTRNSGQEGAAVEAEADVASVDELMTTTGRHDALTDGSVSQPEDRGTSPATTFQRIPLDWQGSDAETLRQIHVAADQIIDSMFGDLLEIVYNLTASVRVHRMGPQGDLLYDADGLPEWERNGTGGYVEDWSQLSRVVRENALFGLTTGMFRWQTQAKKLRGEGLFMKAKMTSTFSHGYRDAIGKRATVDDRIADGRIASEEDRYVAVYRTYLSDRADAMVSSGLLLAQRLKDTALA